MTTISNHQINSGFWNNFSTWRKSAINTFWCLLGCSIGDFGTIAFFQINQITWPTLAIMSLAILNGLITSIAFETGILFKGGIDFSNSFKTAIGMSMVSMISMEVAMNLTDWWLTGGALLTWWAVPLMLLVGFLVPWPYNYWRLQKWGKSCCKIEG